MGDLEDEDHPVEVNAYAAAGATMENKKKKDYSILLSIEVDIGYLHADKEWFESLVQHGSWLKDMHIDVAFYFFHKWIIEKPPAFSQNFTTTDTMVWKNMKARWEKHAKKWNKFQMQADDILVDYVNGLHPIPSMKWSEVDIVYVSINSGDPKSEEQWDIERLHDVPQQEYDGDCGMFLIKYAEYLMHDHPLSSLTGSRIDWFREKMATELSYFKILPM
ncbi:hypothetical protein CK203_102403 [Vitis vinifera]|uniref:Ubiquitin-like protease family profile domain-containing protein n=1 Tax=Vitis vinifera TaxID=29760 RepID=A0A438D9G6_VITVI|nr:hypothetical protein CK203_102403 [Vitis vinifera]